MESDLRKDIEALSRYLDPLIGSNSYSGLSNQENQVLALQAINRINLRIGRFARSKKEGSESMRLLQTQVNSVTVALKRDDPAMLRRAVASLRGLLRDLDPKPS